MMAASPGLVEGSSFVGTTELGTEYDYVIVGGGSAGCVVASPFPPP
jgi:hypothetical protein